MALFGLSFLLLALAAAGLSVGAWRGRPLLHGCGEGRLAGHLLPRCQACAALRARDGSHAGRS